MSKQKWLGALLNFLAPGLGNAYAGKVKKGILTYILFFVIVLSLRFVAYNFILFLVSITLIVGYYLYLIISGYRDVQMDKPDQASRGQWHIYVLLLAAHWILLSSMSGRTLDRSTPINFARIPTPSMDPALQIGDIMAFEKTKSIERHDVTLFWFPDETQTMYVMRCIGLPGDSLRIINSHVLVNGVPSKDIPLKYKHVVITDGYEINPRHLEKLNIGKEYYLQMSLDTYFFHLLESQAKELKVLPFVKSIEIYSEAEGDPDPRAYPQSPNLKWNADFYGPIYIPKKGDEIELTAANIDFYLKCIEFENDSVKKDDTGIRLNGQPIATYQFKQNYYFMMGDNRHNSLDSRYWGLLPEELVIGKAMYLYWGRSRDRVGKKVI
jgi:signal peptidase I